MFLAAKRVIRLHPDWSDEEVADHLGIHKLDIEAAVVPARREVGQDG